MMIQIMIMQSYMPMSVTLHFFVLILIIQGQITMH